MAGTIAFIGGDSGTGSITDVSAVNPLPVTGLDVTLGDINLTEVAGAAIAQGHGVAATAIRVELPTDGTGKVGLNAGTAAIGTLIGDSYAHITTSTTTTVKGTPGTIKSVIVNTLGTIASAVTVQDNTTVIGIIDSLTQSGTFTFNVACATSIKVVTTGSPDITVTYQ